MGGEPDTSASDRQLQMNQAELEEKRKIAADAQMKIIKSTGNMFWGNPTAQPVKGQGQ